MEGADRRSSTASAVRVGLLGPAGSDREALRSGLELHGLAITLEETLAAHLQRDPDTLPADVLLVDLQGSTDRELDLVQGLVENCPLPLVFNELPARARSKSWMRRLAKKLAGFGPVEGSAKVPEEAQLQAPPAPAGPPRVWVLGASFGGPEALKRFLDSMPHAPEAMFLIGQHIGVGFVELLASQLNRSSPFRVSPAADGSVLENGRVLVAPVGELIRLDPQGRIRLVADDAARIYTPSIDALMEEVARCYGPRAGAIVFSGMGDDGTQGAQAIARAGGEVWAQDSASCAISSMPDCAAATGVVSRRGSPEELSDALAKYLATNEAQEEVGTQ